MNGARGRWAVLALMTGAQLGTSVVQQALGSLAPVLVATFALSKAQLGGLFTAMQIGAAAFTAAAGLLTDRWGERRMILASGIIMLFTLAWAAAAPSAPALAAALLCYGVGTAIATPAGGRAVLMWFDRDRGFAMGVRQTGVPLGGLVGAMLLPLAALGPGGFRCAFAVAAVVAFIPTVLAFTLYREGSERPADAARIGRILLNMRDIARDPRFVGVTATSVILVSVQYAVNGFLVVTTHVQAGLAPAIAAAAFASVHASAVAGRLGWGYISDRWMNGDRMLPLACVCVIAAAALAGIAFLPRGAAIATFALAVVLGFTGIGWNGLFAAALAEIGGAERAASAIGLALTATFAASAIYPSVFGAVADRAGLPTAWLLTAGISLFGAVPALVTRARYGAGPSAATTNPG